MKGGGGFRERYISHLHIGALMSKVEAKSLKPWWLRPLWIATLLLTIISGVIAYFILHVHIEGMVGATALTFVLIGIAYYIHVKPSMKVNRALYIWLPIEFCLWNTLGRQRTLQVHNPSD